MSEVYTPPQKELNSKTNQKYGPGYDHLKEIIDQQTSNPDGESAQINIDDFLKILEQELIKVSANRLTERDLLLHSLGNDNSSPQNFDLDLLKKIWMFGVLNFIRLMRNIYWLPMLCLILIKINLIWVLISKTSFTIIKQIYQLIKYTKIIFEELYFIDL